MVRKTILAICGLLIATNITVCSATTKSSIERHIDAKRYYYNQLSDDLKIVYDNLDNCKEEIIENNEKIYLGKVTGSEDYEEIVESIEKMRWAYKLDNPMSTLWLKNYKMYISRKNNVQSSNKEFVYSIFMKPNEKGSFYSFESEDQLNDAIKEVETKVHEFVKELSGTNEEKLQEIYVWLLTDAKYDETKERQHKNDIYGAIVEKECVCGGFAYAFKYIADQAGIPVISVVGMYTETLYTNASDINHAWNNSYINGKWSLIDPTSGLENIEYSNIPLDEITDYIPSHYFSQQ